MVIDGDITLLVSLVIVVYHVIIIFGRMWYQIWCTTWKFHSYSLLYKRVGIQINEKYYNMIKLK